MGFQKNKLKTWKITLAEVEDGAEGADGAELTGNLLIDGAGGA